MSGFINNGLPLLATFTGAEEINLDTEKAGGAAPESAAVTLQQLAAALLMLSQNSDLTTVAGTRYSVSYPISVTTTLGASGGSQLITGVEVLIGSVGGTDKLIVELHDSTGALVATSALAGTTAGTANQWQKIPFTTPYLAAPGTYFISVQSNGNTAKLRTYTSPDLTIFTQSAVGVFGTSASITPPTTYTASVGPVAILYQ